MVNVTSWGRLSNAAHEVVVLRDTGTVAAQMAAGGLAHGMGRSYGDVALNPGGRLWMTGALDRFIAFDPVTGILRCEAGVLLRDIQRIFLPRGWMLLVTPGTQMVTVGGAIANDVHGKNHHAAGAFGNHVHSILLARTDGTTIACGPAQRPDWFAATVGGMGLTGVILHAALQLQRVAGPWLATETIPFGTLAEFFTVSDASEAAWEHGVAWIDCLAARGRGLFMRARPSARHDAPPPRPAPRRMPLTPPVSLVNSLSLRAFNALYYQRGKARAGVADVSCQEFFYPLDQLLEWNRMYGPRGFFQYQSVVPRDGGADAVQAMLGAIARAGEGSFLAVLKTFGDRPAAGMMSFARPGVTLALDFPNRGERSTRLFTELDAIVRAAGGCLYSAKDARMPRDLFESGYPRLAEFLAYRDPGISSAMSRRLLGS
jgi:FAD/FMN-containing dehydrogenase